MHQHLIIQCGMEESVLGDGDERGKEAKRNRQAERSRECRR